MDCGRNFAKNLDMPVTYPLRGNLAWLSTLSGIIIVKHSKFTVDSDLQTHPNHAVTKAEFKSS